MAVGVGEVVVAVGVGDVAVAVGVGDVAVAVGVGGVAVELGVGEVAVTTGVVAVGGGGEYLQGKESPKFSASGSSHLSEGDGVTDVPVGAGVVAEAVGDGVFVGVASVAVGGASVGEREAVGSKVKKGGKETSAPGVR